MNQRGSFSQDILKSIFFDWGIFWPGSFEFKTTNHISIDLWINWLRGTVKIKLESFFFWGILLNFSFTISAFNLFPCLVYIYICLFRLDLGFLYVFEYVKMLDLSFCALLCFAVLLKFLGWFPRTHNPFCVRRLDYVYTGLFMRTHDPAQKP